MNHYISKLLFIAFFLVQNLGVSFAQKVSCDEGFSFDFADDMKSAYLHYLQVFPLPESFYLTIDCYRKDSLDMFRIHATNELFELFYKTPDCYLLDSGVLVYLYTPDYQKRKSDSYRETLMQITSSLSGFPNIIVDWSKDSITEIMSSSKIVAASIDPPYYEYGVLNGEIVCIHEVSEMFYPDTGTPLGIPFNRFRNK